MKLRNKKTGEIEYFLFDSYPVSGDIVLEYMDENAESGYSAYCRYSSLAELNEEWEDYKEPLINDEKVRKAVKAWAEANDFTNEIEVMSLNAGTRFSEGHWSIEFIGYFIYDLKIDSTYTIAELCGEEEE